MPAAEKPRSSIEKLLDLNHNCDTSSKVTVTNTMALPNRILGPQEPFSALDIGSWQTQELYEKSP
jgi:hypothetical protein